MESTYHSRLDLLAILHYLYGGICVLLACVPLFYFGLGLLMMMSESSIESSHHDGLASMGIVLTVLGGLGFLFGQLFAWLIIYSGTQLKKQQKRTLSFIVACILCLFFPFGTILGVFTIITLQQGKENQSLYPNPSIYQN